MKAGLTTAVVALSAAVMTLDMTVVTIALPDIGRDLDAGLQDSQWIVNGYVLVFASLLLGVGALSDRVPRRPLFIGGHTLFGLASLLCALAPSSGWLIAGRVIQALGATLVFATCMPILADTHEGDERGRARAVGAFTAAGAAAAALGPLVGGALVGGGGWRWIFVVNLPVSAVAIAAMLAAGRGAPEPQRRSGSPDWLSTALVAIGVFTLNYALVTGPTSGWGSPSVLAAIVAAAILLLCFARLQLRHGRDALLDLHLFRIPTFSAAMLLSFTGRLVTFGLLPYLIFWLSGRQHLSPVQVGFVLLALALPMVVIAAPSSALGHGNHVNLVTGGAMSVTAIGLLWLGLALGPDATWARALGPLLVIGIGSGAAMPHMMNLALAVVPASRAGAATGAANTAFPLGTATGVAVFGALLSTRVDALPWAPAPAREAIASGRFELLGQMFPSSLVEEAIAAFTSGLSLICFTGTALAALCAVVCFTAIRSQDRRED